SPLPQPICRIRRARGRAVTCVTKSIFPATSTPGALLVSRACRSRARAALMWRSYALLSGSPESVIVRPVPFAHSLAGKADEGYVLPRRLLPGNVGGHPDPLDLPGIHWSQDSPATNRVCPAACAAS